MLDRSDTWTRALRLPDRSTVRGRGVRNRRPGGADPDFGLYLGVDYEPDWPHDWVDWPNYGLPRDSLAAARAIALTWERIRDGERVEVACLAGRGRTGTVIACLAAHAGIRPDHAVSWTRHHYDDRAVQTPWQGRWVRRYPGLLAELGLSLRPR